MTAAKQRTSANSSTCPTNVVLHLQAAGEAGCGARIAQASRVTQKAQSGESTCCEAAPGAGAQQPNNFHSISLPRPPGPINCTAIGFPIDRAPGGGRTPAWPTRQASFRHHQRSAPSRRREIAKASRAAQLQDRSAVADLHFPGQFCHDERATAVRSSGNCRNAIRSILGS